MPKYDAKDGTVTLTLTELAELKRKARVTGSVQLNEHQVEQLINYVPPPTGTEKTQKVLNAVAVIALTILQLVQMLSGRVFLPLNYAGDHETSTVEGTP